MKKYLLCFALLIGSTISDSFAAAGKFNFVIGDVRVTNAAGSRVAAKGMEIEQSDTIIAGQNSMAQLRLTDGAFIALRANTEMRLDQYKFESSQSPSNNAVISLLKGTMRAFTGAIAVFNKDRFKMKTRSATIGIRGSGNVLNYSPENNQTINHTIEGSHTVSTMDARGSITTLVTMPGQTVQVNANGAMKFIPTPAFILESQNSKKEESHDTNATEKSASQSESKKEEKKEVRKEGSRDAKGESKPADEKGQAPKPDGEKKPDTLVTDEKGKAPPPAEGKMGLPLGEPGRFPGEMPRNGYAQTPPLPGSFIPPPFFPTYNPIYPTNVTPLPVYFEPCVPGTISGELYCDGTTFVTPILGRPCPGNISVGAFTCSNGIWVSNSLNTTAAGTPVLGGACSAEGSVSDSLYCDGKTWITPTLGSACVGSGTAGAFTCSGGVWISTTTTTAAGTPTMGSACTTAGEVSDTLYCDGTTWITPTLGSACVGAQTAGAIGCQIGVWVSVRTPAFAAALAAGMMYDAYGATVSIPANGYRHVSYIYGLTSGVVAMETSIDTHLVAGGNTSISFSAPSSDGTATNGTNNAIFTKTTEVEFGYDASSGLSWGRWNGSWTATDTAHGNVTATATDNLHWFATSTQKQAISLPVTGTWNYVMVGNTSPVDDVGNVGLLNSAAFSANFTNQTITTSVNVTVATKTFNATSTNIQILKGGGFKDTAPVVTCTPTCGTPAGIINGQFSQNGAGVGVSYGLKQGTQKINGVVVFKHH